MPRNTYFSANCYFATGDPRLAATPKKLTSGKCEVQLIEIHVSGNEIQGVHLILELNRGCIDYFIG